MKRNFLLIIATFLIASCNKSEVTSNLKGQYTNDELKWMLYSINYSFKPIKVYRFQSEANIKFIECSYDDTIKVFYSNSDTIVHLFRLFYRNIDSLYRSGDNGYCNMIYYSNDKFLFPAGEKVIYSDLKDSIACRTFLYKQEILFIDYLKKYTGPMSTWLYIECGKRNIKLKKDAYPKY